MIYFVAGASDDSSGWNYVERWANIFKQEGMYPFVRLNCSFGFVDDILYTISQNQASWYDRGALVRELAPASPTTNIPLPSTAGKPENIVRSFRGKDVAMHAAQRIFWDVVDTIKSKQISCGAPQLNLIGYSYGSVLVSHIALWLADAQITIDHLVLVGCPIPSDSQVFVDLLVNPYIKKTIRHDIKGDMLSNPQGRTGIISGAIQNASESGPHFDLARPDNPETKNIDEGARADEKIRLLAQKLSKIGVR